MRRIRPNLPTLVSLVVLGLMLLGWWQSDRLITGDTLPKDAELIRRFRESHASLERLLESEMDERIHGYVRGTVSLTNLDKKNYSPDRKREYRILMQRAAIKSFWVGSDQLGNNRVAYFEVESTVGGSKGFVYTEDLRHGEIVSSLDGAYTCVYKISTEPFCNRFMPLEGSWWLIRTDFVHATTTNLGVRGLLIFVLAFAVGALLVSGTVYFMVRRRVGPQRLKL